MFYFLYPLREHFIIFNLLRYITFRSAYAAITSLFLSLFFGRKLIAWLRRKNLTESISKWIKSTHGEKEGTPTMGGLLIISSLLISVFLWCDITNRLILYLISITIWMGGFGMLDDYLKIKRGKGFNVWTKIIIQVIPAGVIGLLLVLNPLRSGYETMTSSLFFKNVFINLGYFYIPFIILVIIGTTNAVNLTDGMDGLAIGLSSIIGGSFALVAYIVGNVNFSDYLNILFISGTGEITVFCTAFLGSTIGFLWFNSHPAEIFMGDTGSLAIGGILGLIAVLLKQELLLPIIGGVFVIEAFSVILQVGSNKLRGKRILKMAPIHHHFHLRGWTEPKVVVRFWIWGIMFALLGLSTLKIR
ncbi:MAG: phospho-N-acetylmuramoyl-pentapeptide-transferase [candidate division WOR-3 bacterium]|nr:phospho-N-acetylmuramoyl-pentapeptide-transferase [candidate division WOR-3 bacterium]